MNNENDELYIFTLNNIIEKLKGKIKFITNEIDYDNIELIIEKSEIKDIGVNDFSISFQKQNGSFTLIINKSINIEKRKMIIDLLEGISGIGLFSSYSFIDMQDTSINHFVYDENKIEFNYNILKQFDNMGQLTDFVIEEKYKPIVKK